MSHPLPEMLTEAMEKVKGMAGADTIMGEPIVVPSGLTIIPISKVSYGFGGGGSDYANKSQVAASTSSFGGGMGVGINVTPVSFMIINGENVRLLPVAQPASNAVERALDMLPDLMEKVSALLKKKEAEAEAEAEEVKENTP